MLRALGAFFLLSSAMWANNIHQVCLVIDQNQTGTLGHPNRAAEANNYSNYFNVFDGQEACFDLDKHYYLQYFLSQSRDRIVYSTKCRYIPQSGDAGKILRYEGSGASSLCPII